MYLDAAQDRQTEAYRDAVETARAGAIFATDQKQYDRWRRRTATTATPGARPLSDAALEAAVLRMAETFPDNVVRGTR